MTPQELKNSILQLAVQGKLVPQRPEEGSAEELLAAIRAQKQSSDSRSTGRKKKNSHKDTETQSDVPADEIPFEIPASWKWVRLGEISQINGGYAFKSEKYTTSGVRVIRISDFNEKGFVDNKIVRYPYDETLSPYELKTKNILLCMTGGTVGKSLFVEKLSERMFVNQRVATIKIARFLPEYANTVILSPFTQSIIESSKNSTNDNISLDTIKNFLIPLPPLAEQKRIVAKIEELLPLCDRYGNDYNELQALNKRVPGDLQKSLLQLAVQGKLVPQRPEEGSAEELLAAIRAQKQSSDSRSAVRKKKNSHKDTQTQSDIPDDEIPFEIPKTWKWVRLGEISNYSEPKEKISAPQINPAAWVLDLEDIEKETGRIIKKCIAAERKISGDKVCFYEGQILYSKLRPYLKKILVAPSAGVCSSEIVPFSVYGSIVPEYIIAILKSPHIDQLVNTASYGIKMPRVGTETMLGLLIPLPPLAEQKRIVAKIEELIPLCDQLSHL